MLVPSAPPETVRPENVSSSRCKLTWTPVPSDHHNGELLGYQIFYKAVYSPQVEQLTVDLPALSKELTGLAGFSRYQMWVAGFTSRGTGNLSQVVECFTDERCKHTRI